MAREARTIVRADNERELGLAIARHYRDVASAATSCFKGSFGIVMSPNNAERLRQRRGETKMKIFYILFL